MLPTTIYNYKDMSKLYKEQCTIGGSKILPHVALGQSQFSVLATAKFENDILDVSTLFASKQQLEENKAKTITAKPNSASPSKDE